MKNVCTEKMGLRGWERQKDKNKVTVKYNLCRVSPVWAAPRGEGLFFFHSSSLNFSLLIL